MIEKRRSKIQGWGVYATTTIPKNKRIIHYAGEKISNQESLKRERRYIRRNHIWCFKLTNRTVIDAGVGGNDARFINHSCDPNCDAIVEDGRIWIETIRDVSPGEELAYDYAYILDERHTPAAKRRYPCNCGAPNCRGTILAKKR
jgi:uncharacterized protein